MEGVTILNAATLPDHVHMYVSIPPKESMAKVVGRIKGKSSQKYIKSSMRGISWKASPQSKYKKSCF